MKVESTKYENSEQYFQGHAAEHFKDDETAQKIQLETDPGRCKTLSRYIKNIEQNEYNQIAGKLMLDANMHKT